MLVCYVCYPRRVRLLQNQQAANKMMQYLQSQSRPNVDSSNKLKILVLCSVSHVDSISLVGHYRSDAFRRLSSPALGVELRQVSFHHPQGSYNLDFWHLLLKDDYQQVAPIYFEHTDFVLCIYDTASLASFETMKMWIDRYIGQQGRTVPIAILAYSRCDHKPQVPIEFACEYASSLDSSTFNIRQRHKVLDLARCFATIIPKAIEIKRVRHHHQLTSNDQQVSQQPESNSLKRRTWLSKLFVCCPSVL